MIIKDLPLALSYDDVLLVPQYSKIDSRSDVDVSTEIAPWLKLDLPLVSTKMDTVTGVEMAVAMGKLGGMGILPRFDRPEAQADQGRQVAKAGGVAAAGVAGGGGGWFDLYYQDKNGVRFAGTSLSVGSGSGGEKTKKNFPTGCRN